MIYFQCKLCRTKLSAQDPAGGQQMRCPNCMSVVTVPIPEPVEEAMPAEAIVMPTATATVAAPSPATRTQSASSPSVTLPPAPPVARSAPAADPPRARPSQYGKRYGFNCVYCSSRLEATEGMAGHEGQCPTCGNAINIPILDRYGRLIDPITKEIIKQDPHPVHAYAAAGERAPGIVRDEVGNHQIICAKCRRPSPITANNCKACGMPFTMEGTAPDAAGSANGFATASLVLGIIGVPFGCTWIVPGLAVIFGGVALSRGGEAHAGRGQAIAGIVCGIIGFGGAILVYFH